MCDFISFPLDTLKTRLQSQHGFLKSGGFRQLYKGLGPVMIGSAPSGKLKITIYPLIHFKNKNNIDKNILCSFVIFYNL